MVVFFPPSSLSRGLIIDDHMLPSMAFSQLEATS